MERAHHTIAYVELGADDLAASRSFYASAFGWTSNDYGPVYAGNRSAGRVVTPIEAYPGGRRFTFADPGGTVLGVFQTG